MTPQSVKDQWKDRVVWTRSGRVILSLLALSVAMAGCATATVAPVDEAQHSPLALDSPLPTAAPLSEVTVQATVEPLPTVSPAPSPTSTATLRPTPSPGQLVLLHTNDNWGETEPCG
jgi:hypothetical protein